MNAAGLAIAGNGLYTEHAHDGVPFFLILRMILDVCGTVEDAITVLTDVPRAVGMTYAIADAHGGAAYVETSAVAVHASTVTGWAAHSNHCLAPEVGRTERASGEGRHNSEARLASARAQI